MADNSTTTSRADAEQSHVSTSSLQGYVDQASGAIQSVVGSLTGRAGQDSAAQAHQDRAAAEHEASHTVGKVGPIAVGAEGGVSKDDPSRQQGQWDQTVGSAKEAVGGVLGSDSLKQQGTQQRAAGQELEARGQLSDLGAGVSDRVEGAVRSAVAGVTGDRDARDHWDRVHDDGKAAQRSAEADIQKSAPQ